MNHRHLSSTDQNETLLETLDQLDLSSEGAWTAIDTGIVDDEDRIGSNDINATCANDGGFGLETIGELELTSECFEAAITQNEMNDETTKEVVSDGMRIAEDPIILANNMEDNEEEKQCRRWLQDQKEQRAKARHVELDRRQAKEQKEKLRKQQMKHAQKWEEDRITSLSKKGKKGKKANT